MAQIVNKNQKSKKKFRIEVVKRDSNFNNSRNQNDDKEIIDASTEPEKFKNLLEELGMTIEDFNGIKKPKKRRGLFQRIQDFIFK